MNSGMRAALAPTGTLRAAINFGNTVLAQRGATLAESAGVSVAIARELARRLDVPLELVPFETARDVVAAAKSGAYDVAFLAGDPARAADLAFTAPYVNIEGGYAVRAASPIVRIDDVDQPGIRMLVGAGSAYDLFLTRTIEHAQITRTDNNGDAVEIFLRESLDVVAGVKAALLEGAAGNPDVRVLDGAFMTIEQAMATVHGSPAVDTIAALIEELKASGFVERELRASGQTEGVVAPLARQ